MFMCKKHHCTRIYAWNFHAFRFNLFIMFLFINLSPVLDTLRIILRRMWSYVSFVIVALYIVCLQFTAYLYLVPGVHKVSEANKDVCLQHKNEYSCWREVGTAVDTNGGKRQSSDIPFHLIPVYCRQPTP